MLVTVKIIHVLSSTPVIGEVIPALGVGNRYCTAPDPATLYLVHTLITQKFSWLLGDPSCALLQRTACSRQKPPGLPVTEMLCVHPPPNKNRCNNA